MTVLENVLVGMHTPHPERAREHRRRHARGTRRAAPGAGRRRSSCSASFATASRRGPRQPAASLSYANRRRLEIARALATRPRLLLLDEPAAGMNPSETQELMGDIRRITASGSPSS